MLLTADRLAEIYGCPVARAARFVAPLAEACERYAIDSFARLAMFVAQVGHESGRLAFVRERWGPTEAQVRYERNFAAAWPPTPADRRNRLAWALGNSEAGDGRAFLGRGLIQTTGRGNTARVSVGLGEDFVAAPHLLEQPMWAALSAGWYWQDRKLNRLADAGEFDAVTAAINGGQNGRDDRRDLWFRALEVLG